MNLVLIIAIFGLQTTLFLMWAFSLKDKLNKLEGQIRTNTVYVEGHTQILNANLEEVAHFQEKALGTLSQNMAMCGYELKEIKNSIDSNTNELKEDIKKSTHIIVTTPVKARF